MSRIAKLPLNIPTGVEFKQTNNTVHVKGPKGALNFDLPTSVAISVEGNVVDVGEWAPE